MVGGVDRAGQGRGTVARGAPAVQQSTPSPDKEPLESYLPNLRHTWRRQRGPGLFLTTSLADLVAVRGRGVADSCTRHRETLSSNWGA